MKIGIVGLGLIGGSLAKALRNRSNVSSVVAFNRHIDVLELAFSEGVIDEYETEITDMFSGCDIIFICTPVDKIAEYVKRLLPFITKNCILTDVGSTKGTLHADITKISHNLDQDITYIGGHPMTGSERFRYSASKEHLFENAYYILTPCDNTLPDLIDKFKAIIVQIGAIPVIVSPNEHDYIVASISHVPHIIASALVNNVKNLDNKERYMHLLAAGGFKDITRIASSSPDMWQSICMENRENILSVLSSLENVIGDIKSQISNEKTDDIYDYFENARNYRDSFTSLTPNSFIKRCEITVDVLDRPGSIAIIAVLFSSHNINIKNMSIVNNREQEAGVLYFAFDNELDRQKSIKLLREMNYDVFIKE